MQDVNGRLWIQTCIITSFRYNILCVLILITRKLQVVYGHSTYRTTALVSKMYSWIERYGWQVMATNTHCSLFPTRHLYILTHILENNGHACKDILHIERLLYYQRHSSCGLELYERSNWKATATDMHQLFTDATLCVYTASPYILPFLVCNYAWQQNSCTLEACPK